MRLLIRLLWIACVVALVGYLSYRDHQRPKLKPGCAQDEDFARQENVFVERVIDGDTVVLADGRHVRYISIDAPERGEANYDAAKRENEKLVLHKWVRMKVSRREKDIYGRTLGELFIDDKSVSRILREKGFDTWEKR